MPTATLAPAIPAAPAAPPVRGSDFANLSRLIAEAGLMRRRPGYYVARIALVVGFYVAGWTRSEEHTSELQSHVNLVCRLLLEKKKNNNALRLPALLSRPVLH